MHTHMHMHTHTHVHTHTHMYTHTHTQMELFYAFKMLATTAHNIRHTEKGVAIVTMESYGSREEDEVG